MQQDEDLLLRDIPNTTNSTVSLEDEQRQDTSLELAVIAYFQRLTALIIEVLSQAIDKQDAQSEQHDRGRDRTSSRSSAVSHTWTRGEDQFSTDQQPPIDTSDHQDTGNEVPVEINTEDIVRMGLDPWSNSDRTFVEGMLQVWWGRTADVRGARVDCCGVRIL